MLAMSPSFTGSTTTKHNRTRRWLVWTVVVGLVLALVFIAFTVYKSINNTPQKVSSDFLNGIIANKAGDSYSLTSPSFRLSTTSDEWQRQVLILSSTYKQPLTYEKEAKTHDSTTGAEIIQDLYKVGGTDNSYNIVVNSVYNQDGKKRWQVASYSSIVAQ